MKIKKDMIIRKVGTETILVPMGNALKEHNGLFMLSDLPKPRSSMCVIPLSLHAEICPLILVSPDSSQNAE